MIWDFRLLVKSFGSYRLSWAVSAGIIQHSRCALVTAAIATNGAALDLVVLPLRVDGAAAAMGISMSLGGIVQLLSPQTTGLAISRQ
jgi:predicted phage tail protein